MVLNYLFIVFFLAAFVYAFMQWVFMGNGDVFPAMLDATFEMAKTGLTFPWR